MPLLFSKHMNSRGSKSPSSKLNEEKVLEIKRLLRDGKTPKEIAPDFGVHPTTIRKIKDGGSWNHVRLDDERK